MNQLSETVLHESLDLLEQGQPIEQILAQFPEAAAELRPFLETAVQLVTLAPQPSLVAKQKSQKAFLAHAQSLKVTPVRPSPWYRLRQILLPIASLAVVLILFATTAVSVSGSAIPGDALYPVKRLVENVQMNRADTPETAVALADAQRQERIREVQTLLRTGRTAEVTFEGEVEAIHDSGWIVATIDVNLDDGTRIVGDPQLGELARVNGRTENGILLATAIEMLTGSATTPEAETTPESTPSPQPTATETMQPTEAAAEPSPTATLAATETPTPTATMTPTMTATPSSTATFIPTQPPADDDDNGNDGGDNNNGGDEGGGSSGNSNDDDDDNDSNDNDNDSNDNDDGGNDNDDGGNDNDDGGNDNDDDDDDDDDDD